MPEREQIINFLLQACDAKTKVIEGLQQQLADLQKQIAEKKSPKDAKAVA